MFSISIGSFALMTSTALMIVSVLLFWSFVLVFSKSKRHRKAATDSLFFAAVAGFAIARISFVIALWDIYQKDWVSTFDITDGGFNHFLGWFSAALVLLFRSKNNRRTITTFFKSALITSALVLPLFVVSMLTSEKATFSGIDVFTDDGESISLSRHMGTPLVVNFWASWCPPCRREMPVLESAQNLHRSIDFVFINQKESPGKAQQFLAQYGIELDNVYFDYSGRSAQKLGSYGLPTTLFFDRDGALVNSHIGALSEASLQHYLRPFIDHTN